MHGSNILLVGCLLASAAAGCSSCDDASSQFQEWTNQNIADLVGSKIPYVEQKLEAECNNLAGSCSASIKCNPPFVHDADGTGIFDGPSDINDGAIACSESEGTSIGTYIGPLVAVLVLSAGCRYYRNKRAAQAKTQNAGTPYAVMPGNGAYANPVSVPGAGTCSNCGAPSTGSTFCANCGRGA
jgi:hypothetical protein